jgi:transposase
MDAKATVYIGPFSRGGKSRQRKKASDHDFAPEETLSLYGIYLPALGESYFNFTKSKATADFITDCLENIWPELLERFNLHTLVINLDNGPENSGRRTQFIKRMVEFANKNLVTVRLAYYPPYHSKYNPVERIWGILENHWRGELLTTIEKTLGLARSMKRKGQSPVVKYIEGDYHSGITLSKKEMAPYEEQIQRMPGLEKWFIDIPPLLN